MLLQILTTQYNDGDACLKRLLDSINIQQGVDFNDIEIIIVNDGDKLFLSEEFQQSWKNTYNFNIIYDKKPWGGLSSTRHRGQDLATAEYIMFCDGDDLFYRANALWDYFKLIEEQHPDIITAQFITDFMSDEKTITGFRTYNNDNVWVHGKMFRRMFLEENNIKWNDDLQIFEDSYYIRQCFALNPKKVNIDETTYFWKYRFGSLSRETDWVTIKYEEKTKSNRALVKNFLDRGMIINAANYVWAQTFEYYFTITTCQEHWGQEKFKEAYAKMEKGFVDYFIEFSDLLKKVPEENSIAMIEVMYNRFFIEEVKPVKVPMYNNKIDFKTFFYESAEQMYKLVTELIYKYYKKDGQ